MSAERARIPNGIKFLFGGLAGMSATVFVQPLDLLKNRMQLIGKGEARKTSFQVAALVVRNEGIQGLYTGVEEAHSLLQEITIVSSKKFGVAHGFIEFKVSQMKPCLLSLQLQKKLSAGLLRQACYTTTRLGIYTWLLEIASGSENKSPNFAVKAGLGMTAGAVGAFVGTPAEVALIRMTADGRLPLAERRNYSNVFNALVRITREEGLVTLWRGCVPTIGRAMVVNAAQLATYSQAKELLLSTSWFSDNIILHFWASMISGLVTTAASMPVDIVKTRIQNMKTVNGVPEYKGALDVLSRVIRNEGFFSLWKGFTPYYARLGPHTVLTFIFLEQFNAAYKRIVLKVDK